jgi:hypothetical protein
MESAMPQALTGALAMRAHPKAHLVPLTRALLKAALAVERDATTQRVTNLLSVSRVLEPGMGVAFVDGNQVIGAGGLTDYGDRAQAWMLVSKDASRRQIVEGVRLARQWLDIQVKDFPCIDLYVRALAPYRASFTAALGFRDTGHVQPWGADDLVCCYERVT